MLHATPNPFLLNKICLNQTTGAPQEWKHLIMHEYGDSALSISVNVQDNTKNMSSVWRQKGLSIYLKGTYGFQWRPTRTLS